MFFLFHQCIRNHSECYKYNKLLFQCSSYFTNAYGTTQSTINIISFCFNVLPISPMFFLFKLLFQCFLFHQCIRNHSECYKYNKLLFQCSSYFTNAYGTTQSAINIISFCFNVLPISPMHTEPSVQSQSAINIISFCFNVLPISPMHTEPLRVL